jgi:hypothetical protein
MVAGFNIKDRELYVHLDTRLFSIRNLMLSLPVDYRIRLMKIIDTSDNLNIIFPDLKPLFKIAHPSKILKKLEKPEYNQELFLAVHAALILNQWLDAKLKPSQLKHFPQGIKIKNWKTFKELHDDLSKQAAKLESLSHLKLLDWPKEIRSLHGLRLGEHKILLPRTSKTLVRWGNAQNHCVGSIYNRQMQEGKCVIAGVFISGELKYCIRIEPSIKDIDRGSDIKKYELVEFRGLNNCNPLDKDERIVNKMLNSLHVFVNKLVDIDGPEDLWGIKISNTINNWSKEEK